MTKLGNDKPATTPDGRVIRYGEYPELTWAAVLVGWLLGIMIAASIAYASLLLGFSIEGSELAAILGWGLLRGVLRRTSIIENNINQTIASAVNGASAGMMFSLAALFILASQEKPLPGAERFTQFDPFLVTLACIAGGALGLVFVIPLRKQMIDFDRLAYPGGIAVAAILRSPGAGMRKAMLLLGGGLFAAALKLVFDRVTGSHDPELPVGKYLGFPPYLNITFYLSIMTIGVGYLSGKGGFWFGVGGFICYWLLAPLLAMYGQGEMAPLLGDVSKLRGELFRPTGIGMLVGAAIGGIIAAFPLMLSAIQSLHDASKSGSDDNSDELPAWSLYTGIALSAVVLGCACWVSVPSLSPMRVAVMTLLGTLWVWIAGVIVSECVGRTNWNPLSGMTLIAVTLLLLIAVRGTTTVPAILAAVVLGTAICVAIAQAGDMMLDLKSGYLVGAVPRRQQIAQFIGAWLGPVVVIVVMYALHQRYVLGSDELPAAQATALATVLRGIAENDAPTFRYVAGTGLGAVLAFSGLGGIGVLIGLGFYMPFSIVLTYTLGNLLRMASDRFLGKEFGHETGVPIAAGFIVGEALVGVTVALVEIGSMLGGS